MGVRRGGGVKGAPPLAGLDRPKIVCFYNFLREILSFWCVVSFCGFLLNNMFFPSLMENFALPWKKVCARQWLNRLWEVATFLKALYSNIFFIFYIIFYICVLTSFVSTLVSLKPVALVALMLFYLTSKQIDYKQYSTK